MANNSSAGPSCVAHNVFSFDNEAIVFSSNFDNGNLAKVERISGKSYEFKIWTAADNMGTSFQSKHNAWFHFVVRGLPSGVTLRITIVNASPHSGLYKHDMRPVYKCSATNQKWARIKSSVRVTKADEASAPQLSFDHNVEHADDKIYFAFTYPYTYSMVQADLATLDAHVNDFSDPDAIFWQRELINTTRDGRRVDLLTISSCEGAQRESPEPLLSGIFPESHSSPRPPTFPNKQIIFVSARVHPGEVPAQWTLKGMLNMLLDRTDLVARELRKQYVVKIVPMLNPDGVYRGHFRMDQFGQNLNRYYVEPDPMLQSPIYGAKKLIDYYASTNKLVMYMDLHAHASKRGCFIYGNVMDKLEDQVQNMLFCRLIAMNTAFFDYEGCLFSREHMTRIDPGDASKGLTAEGSSRVNTYLAHGIIHSYTLECNYNTSKVGNEVPPTDGDPGGQHYTSTAPFAAYPEKFSPSSYAGVGRACLVALLDLRSQNPYSRIPRSKFKSLDRARQAVQNEVRQRKEYKMQGNNILQRRVVQPRGASPLEGEVEWRRTVQASAGAESDSSSPPIPAPLPPSKFTECLVPPRPNPHSQNQVVPLTHHDFIPVQPCIASQHSPSAVAAGSATDFPASPKRDMTREPTSKNSSPCTLRVMGTSPEAAIHVESGFSSNGASTRSPRTINIIAPGGATSAGSPGFDGTSSTFGSFGIRLKSTADDAMLSEVLAPHRPPKKNSHVSVSVRAVGYSNRSSDLLNRVTRGGPGVAKMLLEAAKAQQISDCGVNNDNNHNQGSSEIHSFTALPSAPLSSRGANNSINSVGTVKRRSDKIAGAGTGTGGIGDSSLSAGGSSSSSSSQRSNLPLSGCNQASRVKDALEGHKTAPSREKVATVDLTLTPREQISAGSGVVSKTGKVRHGPSQLFSSRNIGVGAGASHAFLSRMGNSLPHPVAAAHNEGGRGRSQPLSPIRATQSTK